MYELNNLPKTFTEGFEFTYKYNLGKLQNLRYTKLVAAARVAL